MKTASDPRHLARVLAFQHLFEFFFAEREGPDDDLMTTDSLTEIDKIDRFDKELYDKITEGVKASTSEVDEIIKQYAPEWPIEQMSKSDLQILRIGVWEGFVSKTTPAKVATDEAIEIAKEFGGEKSSKFVNGVLGAIIKSEKPEDESSNK